MPEIFARAERDRRCRRQGADGVRARARTPSPAIRACRSSTWPRSGTRSRASRSPRRPGSTSSTRRTDAWVVVVTLAVDGEETQTGFSYAIERGLDRLSWQPVADEAVERGVKMLGAVKPPTAKLPVVLDPFAASSFLGVLAGALNAEAVLKGRSFFADMVGRAVGSERVHARRRRPSARRPRLRVRSTTKGCRAAGSSCSAGGTLNGFLHDTYTARRAGGGQRSTGNAKRGGYRSTPGVGTSNFFVDPGDALVRPAPGEGRGRRADHGRLGRALRREPDQRRVQRRGDRAARSRAGPRASRSAR